MNNRKIIDAIAFAADRHKNQRRKGVGKMPYINHPIAVAKTLSDFGENDADIIISALLHDVIEDTAKNEQEIKQLSEIILKKFGENVLLVVLEVSDNKSLPIDERKRLQVIHTPNLSEQARKLKIADKACNVIDIKNDPPENWTLERKLNYLKWAKEVVDGARGLNQKLDEYFDLVYDDTYMFLTNN